MYIKLADPDGQCEVSRPDSDLADESAYSAAPRGTGNLEAEFVPLAPTSLAEAGITATQVEALAMKLLLTQGTATGREIAMQIALPFPLIEPLLHRLKAELLVFFKAAAPLSDYLYELTETGIQRAQRYYHQSAYCGAAPVTLEDYARSVRAQSVTAQSPKLDDLRRALGDMVLNEQMLIRIGEAVSAGLSFYLSGPPGNGKSSIAARVTEAYGEAIWIPRAIATSGEIIQLYDPGMHEALPSADQSFASPDEKVDSRWVRIRRPTIVASGELTMEQLEATKNPITGIVEAPLQMKSNGGTLVIDDFGRQRVSPTELLNRWIVPLEKRCDFLGLPNGRTFQVPFDQLLVFATNLKPEDLVDEAFLRRIPYKITVNDPSEAEFRAVFKSEAGRHGLSCPDAPIDYLLEKHYKHTGRPLRFCHPRDFTYQIFNACRFRDLPMEITNEAIDAAVNNYFAVTV